MQKKGQHWRFLTFFLPIVWIGIFLFIFENPQLITAKTTDLSSAVLNKIASSTVLVNIKPKEAPAPVVRQKPPQQIVKGLYLTASSANNSKKLDEIVSLLDKTELNALVIDIKDYTGYVLYDSQVPQVVNLKNKRVVLEDIPALIAKLHAHNIYVIARQTVFQDPILAQEKSEWAIKNKQGGVWHDRKGLSWVDGTNQEVWQYNVDIAKEAIDLGFDEVNFDYVRFPTDGNISQAVMPAWDDRNLAMSKFYHYLSDKLKDEPAYISLDFFGLVMEDHSGMGIGQKISNASNVVDYISPMMYPSHYAKGHLGLTNPASDPAKVINYGMKLGAPLFEDTHAKVRPWLQAFNLGAVYGAANIRAQIDEVEKYPNAGWLLWNAANRYTTAGLKSSVSSNVDKSLDN